MTKGELLEKERRLCRLHARAAQLNDRRNRAKKQLAMLRDITEETYRSIEEIEADIGDVSINISILETTLRKAREQ